MNDEHIITFMNKLADEAGIIARHYFRTSASSKLKADQSPVTIADQEIEHRIRELISGHFPDQGILGEEEAAHQPDARFQWVIDPIDGTRAFMAGIPTFTTLIALCDHGVPIHGLIDQPILKERWIGNSNAPLPTSPLMGEEKTKWTLATTSVPYFTESEKNAFASLQKAASSTLLGGDAYLYAMLASDHVDVVVDAGLKPYDFAALVPVVHAHGGVITDWQGKPLTLSSTGRVIASRRADLLSEALAHLKLA